MKIGYFGEPTSHTYACAEENAPEGSELVGYATIARAVEALDSGEIDGAFVPIENSVGGTVGDTLDALKACEVYVTRQFYRPISHSLISFPGATKAGIKRIYSHPNALVQCAEYLKNNFASAGVEAVSSTSAALGIIKGVTEAAIARSPLPGQIVLEADVQDDKNNTTRFWYLSRRPSFSGSKAAVLFDLENAPGTLLRVLEVLARRGLNMNKLESRTGKDGGFRYWFFVEFDCRPAAGELRAVMDELKPLTGFLRLVGTF